MTKQTQNQTNQIEKVQAGDPRGSRSSQTQTAARLGLSAKGEKVMSTTTETRTYTALSRLWHEATHYKNTHKGRKFLQDALDEAELVISVPDPESDNQQKLATLTREVKAALLVLHEYPGEELDMLWHNLKTAVDKAECR